jgi:hypothetical protein
MAQVIPPGVASDGMVKVAFVAALANAAAPTVTELTAATSVDLSCYLTKDGFQPGGEAQAVTDERLCSKQVFEDFGTVTYTIDNLVYIYDPQDAAGDSNKAYAAMPVGTSGWIVAGWGKDAEEAWAAADVVDVYPVKLGPQIKQAPESNSKLKVQQKPYVTGSLEQDVVLAA